MDNDKSDHYGEEMDVRRPGYIANNNNMWTFRLMAPRDGKRKCKEICAR